MVHNGTGHILLLDFLWAHPNSFDWPIKSSGSPNNVCDIYMNIFIYIYIYIYIYIKEKEGVSFASGWPLLLPPLAEREHALSFWTESGCRREELIDL